MEVATASVAEAPAVADIGGGADVSVDTSVGESSPSSSEGEELSENAILDKYSEEHDAGEETPAEAVTATEAKSPEQTTEPAKEAAKEEEQVDQPFEPVIEPEMLKKVWKNLQKNNPEAYKVVRDSWYKTKAYEENFTVPEVRELRQLFNTPQEAKEARAAQADLLAVDDAIHNKPIDLLQFLYKQSPQGFNNLATSLPKALYATDPNLYRAQVSEPAVNHFHEFFAQQAAQTGDEDLKAAIEIIKDRATRYSGGGQRQAQNVTRLANDPMAVRLQELEQQNWQRETQASQSFRDAVDSDFQSSVADQVSQIIQRSGADVNDDAKAEVIDRVLNDITQKIVEDNLLQRQINFSANRPGASRDASHRKQLVDRLTANAKRFLGQTTATHLKWLTEKILTSNRQQLNKQSRVTAHKEITGAGASAPSGTKIAKQQLDKMSENEIMEAAAKGLL